MPVLTGTVIMPLLIQLCRRDKEFTYVLRNLQSSEIFGEHLETIYSQMTVPQIYSVCTVQQEFQGCFTLKKWSWRVKQVTTFFKLSNNN